MNSDFTQLFWGGTLVVALCVHLTFLATRRMRVTLQDIHLIMFYLWMGATIFVAYASSTYGLPAFSSASVTKAYISIWLYIIGILVTKLFNEPTQSLPSEDGSAIPANALAVISRGSGRVPDVLIIGAVAAAILANVTGFFIYGSNFYGAANIDVLVTIPYPIIVLQLVVNLALIPSLFYWACCRLFSGEKISILAVFVIAETSFFHLMSLSRSQIIFDAALVAMAFLITRRTLTARAISVCVALALGVYLIVIPFLYGIRVASQNLGGPNSVAHLVDSFDAWWSGRFNYQTANASRANLAARTLIMGFNYSIVDGLETHSPMYGEALYDSILAVTPRFLYFGQTKVMYSSEAAIQLYYTGSATDTSESWSATGLADFGIIGGLLYGLLLGSMIALGQRLAARTFLKNPLFALIVIGELLNSIIFTEVGPSTLWSSCRDIVIVFVVLYGVSFFVPLAKTNDETDELLPIAFPAAE